jgi:hypothetical protein
MSGVVVGSIMVFVMEPSRAGRGQELSDLTGCERLLEPRSGCYIRKLAFLTVRPILRDSGAGRKCSYGGPSVSP